MYLHISEECLIYILMYIAITYVCIHVLYEIIRNRVTQTLIYKLNPWNDHERDVNDTYVKDTIPFRCKKYKL